MKRLILAAAMASTVVVSVANAQSNVQLYGLLDTGVEYLTHATPQGGTLVRVPTNTATLPSRWGMRGTEDLGNGLQALWTLESGFALSNGTSAQGGRLFGRQSFVGLGGKWGTITIGRQYGMTYLSLLDSDVIGPAIYSMGSYDSFIPNPRNDNSLAYKGVFNGLTVGAEYSTGRDSTSCAGQTAGNFLACREISAMLKYNAAKWGAAVAFDEQRGGAGSAPATIAPTASYAMARASSRDRRLVANGYFVLGPVKVGGGWIGRWIHSDVTSVSSNLFYLGASYAVSVPLQVDAQVVYYNSKDANVHSIMYVARATYSLSKRTAVYAQTGFLTNGAQSNFSVSGATVVPASPAMGGNQLGVMLGVRHTF